VRFLLYIIFLSHGAGATEFEMKEVDPPRPLLELGIGVGTGLLPDYPGSDQEHYHFAGFPVLFYHGQIFRSDREDGARARVVNKPTFGIDVSGSGAFPIGEENRARAGMKSLGWLAETGPRVFARIVDNERYKFRAFTLARPAVSLRAGRLYGRGMVFGTGFQYERDHLWTRNLSLYSKLTAQFASREYMDYFYTVGSEDVTPTRAAYRAKAGYLGTWWSLGLAYEVGDVIVSAGGNVISTKGATNDGSSLFRDDMNFGMFVGLAWFFYHSEKPGYY